MGKDGKLWRLDVLGKVGHATYRYHAENRTSEEVTAFREGVYRLGLMYCIDPGHWIVIHPMDILEFHLYKQAHFFET